MNAIQAIHRVEQERPKMREVLNRYIPASEVDDLIQLAYERMLSLTTDIIQPHNYFLATCRHIHWASRRTIAARAKHTPIIPERIDPDLTPEQRLEFEQEFEEIEHKLSELPTRSRRVFEMAFLEGYIYSEIANYFQISESFVKKILAQVKRKLGQYESRSRTRYVSARARRSPESFRGCKARGARDGAMGQNTSTGDN